MSATPKRLVAYVERPCDDSNGETRNYFVEGLVPDPNSDELITDELEMGTTGTLLLAMMSCEEKALSLGFDLRWHGFVAHGVRLQEERVDD